MGRKQTEETKRKISEKARARWANPDSKEARKKASETMKKNWQDPEYREQHIVQSLDALKKAHETVITEETRANLSESTKRLWQDKDFREKTIESISKTQKERFKYIVHPFAGRSHSNESKVLMSEKAKERCQDENWREKKSKEQKAWLKENGNPFEGQKHTDKSKEIISKKAKQRYQDQEWLKWYRTQRKPMFERPEFKEKISRATKERFKNPEYREKVLNAFTKKKPTSLEIAVASILDSLEIEYEAQKIIDRAIVDFYIPSKNLIIEADGEYWHNKKEVKRRDQKRDGWLRSKGYTVIRLSEVEIKQDPRKAVEKALNKNEAE